MLRSDRVALWLPPTGHDKDAAREPTRGRKSTVKPRRKSSRKEIPPGAISLTKEFETAATLLRLDAADKLFEDHLRTEYAEENIWFWRRAMKFRSTTFSSPQLQRKQAHRIYDEFLCVKAPNQVNVGDRDRATIRSALDEKPGAEPVTFVLFDESLCQVERILARGNFPRFAGDTVKNIENSWEKMRKTVGIEDAGDAFYARLFEQAPQVKSMFTRPKRVQGKMLMSIVGNAVEIINNLDQLTPVLLDLGKRHRGYKVKPEHFPVVGDVLIATLRSALGKDFTTEVEQSWAIMYNFISKIMISVLDTDSPGESGTGTHQPQSQRHQHRASSEEEQNREIRRRKTLELMSQGGLNLKHLLDDPNNDSTPVEAMRAIMTRGKEHGWTMAQLFGVFLEPGSEEEHIPFSRFQTGLLRLGLTIPAEDEREIFKTFDTDNNGTIELIEFIRWCLDIDSMAWKAERIRRTTADSDGCAGRDSASIGGKCAGIDQAATAMAAEASKAQLCSEKPRHPLGKLIYEGSKLFWRIGESLRIAMHENKDLHCVVISTMLDGGSEPFPVLQVDSRLIRDNGKDAVLEKAAEITEAGKDDIQSLREEERARIFDKARASVISDYLLARLQLVDGGHADGTDPGTSVTAAAASAAARLGLGPERQRGEAGTTEPSTAEAAAEGTEERERSAGPPPASGIDPGAPGSLPVTSGSVILKGRPMPVLVKLPEDDGFGGGDDGAGYLLLKEKLDFSEVHQFSKHVSYQEFERVEHMVSEGLKEGHRGIEVAKKAQRRSHGSLENAHHRTSREGVKPLLSSSSAPTTSSQGVGMRTSASSAAGVTRTSGSGRTTPRGTTLPPADGGKKRASSKAKELEGHNRNAETNEWWQRRGRRRTVDRSFQADGFVGGKDRAEGKRRELSVRICFSTSDLDLGFRCESFGKAGEPPVRCKLHKAEGDINVKNPICIVQGCTSRSRFGKQGSKPVHCKDHREPGEVNPFRPPCVYPGCVVTPTYAEEGRKPARCAKHKKPTDINTNRQRCGERNCRERPCFVNYVTGVKHCLNHFTSGDTGGLRGMCQARDPGSEAPCRKYATFSKVQGKPLRCKDHKLVDDVDVLNKMCEHAMCFKRPSFAPMGEASKRCKSHALSGDINVNGKRCLAVGCKTFVAVKKKTCKAHAQYLD
eukprot:g3361.t1